MILYANSDSYGVLSTGKTYTDFIGQQLNCKVVNNGLPGSCNNRILRRSVRDLLELKKQNNNILAIFGLAHPNRTEYWSNEAIGNDGHFKDIQPNNCLTGDAKKFSDAYNRLYDDEAATTNLLFQLAMFTSFLNLNNIKYLIWMGTKNMKAVDFSTPFIKQFYEKIQSDSNIVDLFDFSFSKYCSIDKNHIPYDYNRYQYDGHHAEPAHEDFANYLLENYLNETY